MSIRRTTDRRTATLAGLLAGGTLVAACPVLALLLRWLLL